MIADNKHDPLLCGLWNYDGPPLCPACRAELSRRGIRWPSAREQEEAVERYVRERQPGEDAEED